MFLSLTCRKLRSFKEERELWHSIFSTDVVSAGVRNGTIQRPRLIRFASSHAVFMDQLTQMNRPMSVRSERHRNPASEGDPHFCTDKRQFAEVSMNKQPRSMEAHSHVKCGTEQPLDSLELCWMFPDANGLVHWRSVDGRRLAHHEITF